MNLKNPFSAVERGLTEVLDKIRWPGAITLFLMALLTTADVIGRYIFLKPILGNSEIQQVMMVTIIFLGLGYCTIKARHANADIVISHLSERLKAILGSITWFLSAAIFGLISWQVTQWGWSEVLSPTRVSQLLLIRHGPFIMVAAFGCIAICLGSLVNFFHSFDQLRAREVNKQ
jgi:TRAP-type C4-dicarboxylate transport system permease small subunit